MQTLIIGGGLSGLALAEMLEARGQDYLLLEARARFGGRIKIEHHDGVGFDMGPAWFWPGQPRLLALTERLGLEKFDQFSDGALTFEDENGRVQRDRGFASMQGSWRLKDGLGALTQGLVDRLPAARLRLNAHVTQLALTARGVTAVTKGGETFTADRLVLALPPRLAAEIGYTPALSADAIHALKSVPTWMAGQAKAMAIYDRPFWREAGLSGDAMSRFGPMVEVHDASPAHGGPYALFGFVGVPPDNRGEETILRQHLVSQLGRLFGAAAENPVALYIKDWAIDPHTASASDRKPIYAHPTYAMPQSMVGVWDGKLHLAGTEVAPQFGGYLEGALEAAENVLSTLNN
ncbi:FAD-dependent oxidoreductase [uncultured Roseobacter sp.]|uniref:flavin monoamine oxidase family protein n=1 Tax=uncultured Roseobacter sp. TaxID=114847 RepID=UPI0026163CC7|nr:FAD-dependent oxidoreductase [uncultured Roseobacter sp.]